MGTAVRPLSPRHQRVATLLNEGRSARDIASRMGLTLNTAKTYIAVVRRHARAVAADAQGDHLELTKREDEVAALRETGATDREIADHQGLSVRTVEEHVARLLRKPGRTRRAELVRDLEPSTGIGALSFRELQVLQLFAQGLSQEAVAHPLSVDLRTVQSHVYRIRLKLEVAGYGSLTRFGMKPRARRRP